MSADHMNQRRLLVELDKFAGSAAPMLNSLQLRMQQAEANFDALAETTRRRLAGELKSNRDANGIETPGDFLGQVEQTKAEIDACCTMADVMSGQAVMASLPYAAVGAVLRWLHRQAELDAKQGLRLVPEQEPDIDERLAAAAAEAPAAAV